MSKVFYKFTAYKGPQIIYAGGYRTLKAALKVVRKWQGLGWFVDYVVDSDEVIAKVIGRNAMAKASIVNDMSELMNEQLELENDRLNYDDKGQI